MRIFLATVSTILLCGCAPNLSKVAGDYSQAVDSGEAALADTVKANSAARKALDYQRFTLEERRPSLELTPQCDEIAKVAAWSGGALVSPEGAPNEDERKRDLEARQARLEMLAKDCAVVAIGSKTPEIEEPPDSIVSDPIYLCGIDPKRLTVKNVDTTQVGVSGGQSFRIPPPEPVVLAQTEIMKALSSYAQSLKEAAEARDIQELEQAAQKVVNSLSALALVAGGPYGVVVAPVVSAVGNAAVTLAGAGLREKRFKFIKGVVIEADQAVRDSTSIICHSALVLSYEIVRSQAYQLDDLVSDYNINLRRSGKTFQADRAVVERLRQLDVAVVTLRGVGKANYGSPILGIADAHSALKTAVEDPDTDFKEVVKQLGTLLDQFDEIRKATSALANS